MKNMNLMNSNSGLPANVVLLNNSNQVPTSQILHHTQNNNQGIQAALSLAGQPTNTLFHYTQRKDGSTMLIPVSVDATNQLSKAQLANSSILTSNAVTSTVSSAVSHERAASPDSMSPSSRGSTPMNINMNMNDSSKKRELRLLKNREAARDCRRKKKEYVRCLENRVTVLESQNQKLIIELQRLKQLYAEVTENARNSSVGNKKGEPTESMLSVSNYLPATQISPNDCLSPESTIIPKEEPDLKEEPVYSD